MVTSQLGYTALAGLILGESAGLPLPGKTALISAGGLVAAGRLSLPVVVVVAAAAAVIGDTIGYWVGRRGGGTLLLRGGLGASHRRLAVARADRFFARYGVGAVFFARWIPGVRVVAAVTAGAARMSSRRFAPANAAGALAWAASIGTLAALAGTAGWALLAVVGLTLVGIGVVIAWRSHRRAPRASVRAEAQVRARVRRVRPKPSC